jgi:adenylylsulfate kinase
MQQGSKAPSASVACSAGTVFWITGLSASGKTTVAAKLCERLRASGRPVVLLDGDRLRAVLDAEGAHAPEDRLRLAMTYARLCRELAGQGFDVVCATISMFHAVREWNRAEIARYREIYLRVPTDVLRKRDPKGIYARHAKGVQAHVVGHDLQPELPRAPDLVIDNDGPITPDAAVELIWQVLSAADGRAAA